ncbi:MAG: hypothetical protein ABJB85_09815 [Nitrososphaerota archaeon]
MHKNGDKNILFFFNKQLNEEQMRSRKEREGFMQGSTKNKNFLECDLK